MINPHPLILDELLQVIKYHLVSAPMLEVVARFDNFQQTNRVRWWNLGTSFVGGCKAFKFCKLANLRTAKNISFDASQSDIWQASVESKRRVWMDHIDARLPFSDVFVEQRNASSSFRDHLGHPYTISGTYTDRVFGQTSTDLCKPTQKNMNTRGVF